MYAFVKPTTNIFEKVGQLQQPQKSEEQKIQTRQTFFNVD